MIGILKLVIDSIKNVTEFQKAVTELRVVIKTDKNQNNDILASIKWFKKQYKKTSNKYIGDAFVINKIKHQAMLGNSFEDSLFITHLQLKDHLESIK